MNTPHTEHFTLDESRLHRTLKHTPLQDWVTPLIESVTSQKAQLQHGDFSKWQTAVSSLPDLAISTKDYEHESGVAALTEQDVAADKQQLELGNDAIAYALDENATTLEPLLKQLMPWRKGPFRIAHVNIDTEWRSDWKWNRVLPHITPLQGRTVLDVGCGSGYHLWRMRGAGATTVLGIDPGLLFQMQFEAIQHYMNDANVAMLPLPLQALPANMHAFDTVFSMGVLYHRKQPETHLAELKQALRTGGELVLETLVALGEDAAVLNIDDRYARMRNVWQLPSVPMLARWLHDAGFTDVQCVSVDITSRLEQRTTQWMPFESLTESLNPEDLSRTVEGYPRPRRAVMIAKSK